jgi:hypothetical protein
VPVPASHLVLSTLNLSLSQQHRGAHVGDVSNRVRPAKPVLKIVGSRSIGTPKPQPPRTDRHRTLGLQLRHLAHPST